VGFGRPSAATPGGGQAVDLGQDVGDIGGLGAVATSAVGVDGGHHIRAPVSSPAGNPSPPVAVVCGVRWPVVRP
jgi:hypothetical protein